jgi:hypothetical protein
MSERDLVWRSIWTNVRNLRSPAFIAILWFSANESFGADFTLIPYGSVWNYYAAGPVETNWQKSSFSVIAWPAAPASLGWGESEIRTMLAPNPEAGPRAVYFRRDFAISNRREIEALTLRLVADDGAVVYLNGTEVDRRNIPVGVVRFETGARSNLETNEGRYLELALLPALVGPTNTLAIELHQHPEGRHDARFDVQLVARSAAARPTLAITGPPDGARLESEDLSIEVAASPTVAAVYFFTNGVFMGFSNQAPFTFAWAAPLPGNYRVTARAYDQQWHHADAAPVHLQIGNAPPPRLLRGPYLQCGSPTGMVVRWRTDAFTDAVVRYGTNSTALDQAVTNTTFGSDHEVQLSGLSPDTSWFYSVGSTSHVLAAGSEYRFRTSPTNARSVRIWAVGDSGTGDQYAVAVRDSYYNTTAGMETDLMLMLGDNVYGEAADWDFQEVLFDMYRTLLSRTVVWPALGNHDVGDSWPGDASIHVANFTLPAAGQAGGVASGTELYYSFDYANIHLIAFDSNISDLSADGPMLRWLQRDLAATDKDWIIAYWHHPPYSWGGHDSDGDPLLSTLRERVVPILESNGVDLVLCGHSHEYERSFLMDGHYGFSWEWQPECALNAGLGRTNAGGSYLKPAGGFGAHQGTVYVVCGNSGQGGSGDDFRRHPAMATNLGGFGSLVIQVDELRLEAQLLRPSGAVADSFTIDKSLPSSIKPPVRIAHSANSTALEFSWPTSLPTFYPERSSSLPAPKWEPLTIPVQTYGRRNVVVLQPEKSMEFFRLSSSRR